MKYRSKSCDKRKSATSWGLDELVDFAVAELGMSKSAARRLGKQELCKRLSEGSQGKTSKKEIKKTSPSKATQKTKVSYAGKSCEGYAKKGNQKIWNKQDLAEEAVKKLKIGKSTALRMSKVELCKAMNNGSVPSTKKKGKSAAVKITTGIKYKSPKKKQAGKKTSTKKKAVTKRPLHINKANFIPAMQIPPNSDCITKSKVKLKEHQIKIAEFLQNPKNRGVIAAFDTGSGKTLTAIAASQCIIATNPEVTVLVVTPTSLQGNFKKEMEKYGVSPSDKHYKFMTIGTFANKYSKEECDPNTFLIIDEAHNLRSNIYRVSGGKRSQIAIECAMRTYKTLLLTATPVYNYPHDLANLIAMTKGESPLTDKEFDELVNGNKKVFDDYFDCVIYFYELDSKSGDYPEKTEEWINIPMTQQYYKDYMKVETLKSPDYKSPFIFLTGIRQATNSLEDAQKPRWAIRKIKEGQKTIVYSQFVDRGIETVKRLMPKNIKYAEITGKLTQKERNQIVKDFNSDAKGTPNVLLFTKAGAEGLDLKGVRNVIILESGWNRENEKQVLGRAVRYLSHSHLPMEERHVNIYHLVLRKPDKRIATDDGKESADEMLRKLIERKDKENQKFLKRLKNKKFDKCIGK